MRERLSCPREKIRETSLAKTNDGIGYADNPSSLEYGPLATTIGLTIGESE